LAKDFDGSISEAETEQLNGMYEEFYGLEERYQDAKSALEERQKIANDKAFNKATADSVKTKAALETASKANETAKKALDTVTASITKQ
jgi:hypothetical protein